MLVKIVHGFNKTSNTFELKARFDKKSYLPYTDIATFAKIKIAEFKNIRLVIHFLDFVYIFIVAFNKLNLKQIYNF